jgi:hypothetical protein
LILINIILLIILIDTNIAKAMYSTLMYGISISKTYIILILTVILSNFRKTRIVSNRIGSDRIQSNLIFFKNLEKKKHRIKLSNLYHIKIKN